MDNDLIFAFHWLDDIKSELNKEFGLQFSSPEYRKGSLLVPPGSAAESVIMSSLNNTQPIRSDQPTLKRISYYNIYITYQNQLTLARTSPWTFVFYDLTDPDVLIAIKRRLSIWAQELETAGFNLSQ